MIRKNIQAVQQYHNRLAMFLARTNNEIHIQKLDDETMHYWMRLRSMDLIWDDFVELTVLVAELEQLTGVEF